MPRLTELGRQWNDAIEPPDHQPWNTLGLSDPGMTHEAEQPNSVPGIVEAVRRYLQSGDYNPVHGPGTEPRDYLRELLRNPDIMAKNIDQASQFIFGGVTKPQSAAMAAASRAVPLGGANASMMRSASDIHPDIKQNLIDSLYGNAAAERDATQLDAVAASMHRLEKESGFALVKDPAERKRMGLPPLASSVPLQNPLDFSSLIRSKK